MILLDGGRKMKYPFVQEELNGKLIREFSEHVNSSELVWHRDKEDRIVTVLEGSGWMLQIENKLPVLLETNTIYHIPKNMYHRVIKGSNKLVVEIKKRNILKLSKKQLEKIIREAISLDIKKGDVILTGKFKNKRTIVKDIGKDEYGHPTVNGKSILKFKIEKFLPKEKQSKKTQDKEEN